MFWDPKELREHQRTQHQGQGNESEYEPENEDFGSQSPAEESDSETDSKFGDFYCDVCGMTFHRFDLMTRHAKQHMKRERRDSGGDGGGIGAGGEESSGHCCNVCGETFIEALDLLAHAEVHARFQPLKCLMCGESFIEEAVIKNHIQTIHANDLTEFTCRLCGKLCRDSRTLMKHSWDHSKEKNHSCSKCGKTFLNKARLKRHMVSHRNKSVTCDVCSEEFPDGRSLMNHRHSHSNVPGRQFPCRDCGKTFGSRSSQQIHIRIHTGERPYGCRFCWKAFADGGTLRKHERIHTGEKPYVCSVCPRAFNQRVVLREHIRTHHSSPDTRRGNPDTPYYCQVCEELFSTSVDLIHHLIEHSDTNTAMKRAPVMGPRKYKRRRKLKPHELERLKSQKSDKNSDEGSEFSNDDDDPGSDDDEISEYSTGKELPTGVRGGKNTFSVPSPPHNNSFPKSNRKVDRMDIGALLDSMYTTPPSPVTPKASASKSNTTTSTSNAKSKKSAKAGGSGGDQVARPKMIHTQKTRVAIEDGKRKTKTMITRTTSGQEKSGGSRRSAKNKNYEMVIPDSKIYPADEPPTEMFAIKQEDVVIKTEKFPDPYMSLAAGFFDLPRTSLNKYNSDIVNDLEEILRSPIKATPTANTTSYTTVEEISGHLSQEDDEEEGTTKCEEEEILVHQSGRPRRNVKQRYNIKVSPKRTPPSATKKSTASSKGSSSSKSAKQEQIDYGSSSPIKLERELVRTDDGDQYRCEMCAAVFSNRAQLLIHVPIHI